MQLPITEWAIIAASTATRPVWGYLSGGRDERWGGYLLPAIPRTRAPILFCAGSRCLHHSVLFMHTLFSYRVYGQLDRKDLDPLQILVFNITDANGTRTGTDEPALCLSIPTQYPLHDTPPDYARNSSVRDVESSGVSQFVVALPSRRTTRKARVVSFAIRIRNICWSSQKIEHRLLK